MNLFMRFFSRSQPPTPPPVLKVEPTALPVITPRMEFEISPEGRIYQVAGSPTDQLCVRCKWMDSDTYNPMPEIILDLKLDGGSSQSLRCIPSASYARKGGRVQVQRRILPSQINKLGGVTLTIPFGPEALTRVETPDPAHLTPPSSSSKIPKPHGEPGRPKSGGFNLELTLRNNYNWSKADVKVLMVYTRKEATRTLSMNHSLRSQKEAIDRICDKAMEAENWSALSDYDNCWPVRSALKLILKYRSEASRQGRKARS